MIRYLGCTMMALAFLALCTTAQSRLIEDLPTPPEPDLFPAEKAGAKLEGLSEEELEAAAPKEVRGCYLPNGWNSTSQKNLAALRIQSGILPVNRNITLCYKDECYFSFIRFMHEDANYWYYRVVGAPGSKIAIWKTPSSTFGHYVALYDTNNVFMFSMWTYKCK